MKVDCNGCGSPLAISDTTHFVTCAKCAARLEVKRSDTSLYTEVLDTGVKVLKQELARLEAHPASAEPGGVELGGEAVLRLIVGSVVIASDVFWWITDPSLQSFYVRVLLLIAGFWLVLSGAWRGAKHTRERLHRMHAAKAKIDVRKKELEHVIAEDDRRSSS